MTNELTLNDSKNAIALLMESMQHVSLSGERGWTASLRLVGESRILYVRMQESVLMFRQSAWRKVNTALSERRKVCRTLLLSGEKGGPMHVGG